MSKELCVGHFSLFGRRKLTKLNSSCGQPSTSVFKCENFAMIVFNADHPGQVKIRDNKTGMRWCHLQHSVQTVRILVFQARDTIRGLDWEAGVRNNWLPEIVWCSVFFDSLNLMRRMDKLPLQVFSSFRRRKHRWSELCSSKLRNQRTSCSSNKSHRLFVQRRLELFLHGTQYSLKALRRRLGASCIRARYGKLAPRSHGWTMHKPDRTWKEFVTCGLYFQHCPLKRNLQHLQISRNKWAILLHLILQISFCTCRNSCQSRQELV